MKGKTPSKKTKEKSRKTQQKFIYYIEGNKYISSKQAAQNLKVAQPTILVWCKSNNKPNCYREAI